MCARLGIKFLNQINQLSVSQAILHPVNRRSMRSSLVSQPVRSSVRH